MASKVFIQSLAQVSCQKPLSDEWFASPSRYEESYARAQEPDTKGLIVPSEARRMSRILKRTVSTSITALNDSGIRHPDAIITGTGMGCMENSEKFLIDLSRFGENCLKPTLFMQSTHNTISSLIAIILKCHGYNNTYSHKGISFESALLDAWMQLRSGQIASALVGAHDEVTPFMNLVLRRTHPEYDFISEASVSAILSATLTPRTICEIEDVKLFYRPRPEALAHRLSEDADRVMLLGVNGNELNDKPYEKLIEALPFTPQVLRYKHIFGDSFSAPALAFYVGARILERGSIPPFMSINNPEISLSEAPGRITILNQSENSAWSLIRLKRV